MGLAADFCPICRDFRAFHVTEVRKVAHLYYVPLGRGSTLMREIECVGCRSLIGAGHRQYAAFSTNDAADVVELARETNPDVMSMNRPRIDLEDRLAEGALTADERAALIAEPFQCLDYMVSKKLEKGSLSAAAALAIGAAVVLALTAVAAWTMPGGRVEAAILVTALAVAAAIAAGALLRFGPRRWVRRHIHPRLVAALLPLDPSLEEVARAVHESRRAKRMIGKRLSPTELFADLARARAAAGR